MSEALEDAEKTRTRQVHHSRQEGEIKRCEFESAMQKIRSLEAQNAHLIDSEQAKLAELKYFRSKDQLAPAEDVSYLNKPDSSFMSHIFLLFLIDIYASICVCLFLS